MSQKALLMGTDLVTKTKKDNEARLENFSPNECLLLAIPARNTTKAQSRKQKHYLLVLQTRKDNLSITLKVKVKSQNTLESNH
jgi:hypothetical protein